MPEPILVSEEDMPTALRAFMKSGQHKDIPATFAHEFSTAVSAAVEVDVHAILRRAGEASPTPEQVHQEAERSKLERRYSELKAFNEEAWWRTYLLQLKQQKLE